MTISVYLSDISYPGRTILCGLHEDGDTMMALYFLTGRSVNSRNRVFERTSDGIRTKPFVLDQMTDPSLIIYHPVRQDAHHAVITNGAQTDAIWDAFCNQPLSDRRRLFMEALDHQTYEPDAPHHTPRISCLVDWTTGAHALHIVKDVAPGAGRAVRQVFFYDEPRAGLARIMHTYQNDGNPLPSFSGEPRAISLTGKPADFARQAYDALLPDRRVSLFAQWRSLSTGRGDSLIINTHSEEPK